MAPIRRPPAFALVAGAAMWAATGVVPGPARAGNPTPASTYPELRRPLDVSLLAGSAALLAIGESLPVTHRDIPPQGLDRNEISWSLDRSVIGEASIRADNQSDYYRDAVVAYPLLLAFARRPTGTRVGDSFRRALTYGEAVGLAEGVAVLIKTSTDRPRPFTYLPSDQRPDKPAYDVTTDEAFRSMPSGHATISFCAAGFAMTDNLLSNPDAGWLERSGVACAGGFLAGLTAALRVEGGQHFPTDTIVGGLIGTASGVTVPLLHRPAGPGGRKEPLPTRRAWWQAAAGEAVGIAGGILASKAY